MNLSLSNKKNILVLICFVSGLFHFNELFSQTSKASLKANAEKELVGYLNKLVKTYTSNEMTIDMGKTVSPFRVDAKGNLVTIRSYTAEDGSNKILVHKISLPVNKIESVFYDYYIGFVGYDETSVIVDSAANSKGPFAFFMHQNLFHITAVGGEDGIKVKQKLIALLHKLQLYYPLKKK